MRPERRSCRRFHAAGATLDWDSETDPAQRGTECPVGDLSRGGVRFSTPGPPRPGSPVTVTLSIPGEAAPLRLRGSVAWTLMSSGQFHQVGIAFAPYSSAAGANEQEALERLVAIEERFPGESA